MNYDKLILSIVTNGKGIIPKMYEKMLTYPNIMEYVTNRYTDSESTQETIRRMKFGIEVKPVCPVCGKPVKYIGKPTKMFQKYCSTSCRAKDYAHDAYLRQVEYNKHTYGKEHNWEIDKCKDKRKETLLDKYGTLNMYEVPGVSEKAKINLHKSLQTMVQRVYETKKKNNTFHTSKPEDETYEILSNKWPDVTRQYKSKEYPFACDFYIPSLDLYIECQYGWTHGDHPFDENNEKDREIIDFWESSSQYYKNAAKTWKVRDIKKRKTAKENNLNWIEFFNIDEFKKWFNEQSA